MRFGNACLICSTFDGHNHCRRRRTDAQYRGPGTGAACRRALTAKGIPMKNEDSTRADSIRNCGFTALACLALAFLLLECCLVQFDARPPAHAVVLMWGSALIAGIYVRLASYRFPASADPDETRQGKRAGASRTAALATLPIPAAFGFVGTHFVAFGLMTPFAIFAVTLHLLPWSRMGVLRKGFCLPLLAWAAGAIAALPTVMAFGHPLLTALAAWIMAGSAGAAWVRLIVLKNKNRGRPVATLGRYG